MLSALELSQLITLIDRPATELLPGSQLMQRLEQIDSIDSELGTNQMNEISDLITYLTNLNDQFVEAAVSNSSVGVKDYSQQVDGEFKVSKSFEVGALGYAGDMSGLAAAYDLQLKTLKAKLGLEFPVYAEQQIVMMVV
jgi:hypothetical protein